MLFTWDQVAVLIWLAAAASTGHALVPTAAQLAAAAAARAVKVYTYTPADGGMMPAMDAFAANGAACSDTCPPMSRPGGAIDLCNHAYGRAAPLQYASALQGWVWANHDYGRDIGLLLQGRLQQSHRVVTNPAEADLKHIPYYSWQFGRPRMFSKMRKCGLNWYDYTDPGPELWRWMLEQQSFRDTDCSDHFMVINEMEDFLTSTFEVPHKRGQTPPPHVHPLNVSLASGFTEDDRRHLDRCFRNLQIISIQTLISEERTELPNCIALPFSTRFHYVPAHASRPLKYYPSKQAALAAAGGGATGRAGAVVGSLPLTKPWAPEKLFEHDRPVFMSYVSLGAQRNHFEGDLWKTKELVGSACADSPSCFNYHVSSRQDSAARLLEWPLVPDAVRQLGYESLDDFRIDVVDGHEALNILSSFCLAPPGDYAIRRGFWDALLVGCVPVVFDERSRPWHTVFPHGDPHSVSVLLPAETLERDAGALVRALREFEPQLPRLRRNIAQYHAQFQFAVADMGATDHAAVGPDAFDLALMRMAESAKRATRQAGPQPQGGGVTVLQSTEDMAQWRRMRAPALH